MVSKAQAAISWPVFRPRGWGQPTSPRALPLPWYGLDTERDHKTGVFVTGKVVGENVLSFKRFTDLPPATYWVWNLAYDIEGMIRDLDIPEAWAARSDGSTFPLLDGNAIYYHGKRFDYKVPKLGKWSFIEASSFFNRCALAKVGPKRVELVDSKTMSLERYLRNEYYQRPDGTWGYYATDVDTYCEQDARIVYNAITDLAGGLRNLGVEIGATPGATARRFLARLGPFPDILWQTHKPFLRSYCGGRFEVTKRGVFHDVKQYDIASAYPWALAQCPWLTESAYHRMTRRFSDNALYGTYEVSFKYDHYLGVAPRWRGGVRVYSKQEERTWITRPELAWLLQHGAEVKIWSGVEVFDEGATDLWRQIITGLYDIKAKDGTNPQGRGAKVTLNSQYGILIQLIRRSGKWVRISEAKNPVDFAGTLALEEPPKEFEGGKYFAPLYAGNLTGLTRVRLLDAAIDMGPDLYIGGHTDSVIGMGRLTKGLSSELGGWKLEKEAPRAEVCKTGMYSVGSTVKVRGITRDGKPSMFWEESHTRNSRIGIKTAHSWDEVSVIVPKTVANNYGIEQKRKWHGEVTRGLIAMEKYVDSEALAMVGT